jgi:light-regulated signal transduction histidine kinase (bacteriophytochrome)
MPRKGRSSDDDDRLHIAKELVEKQGGKVWVESVSEKGSCFRFTVPVYSGQDLLISTVES